MSHSCWRRQRSLSFAEERAVRLAADGEVARTALVDALGVLHLQSRGSMVGDISSLVSDNLSLGEQVKGLVEAIEAAREGAAAELADALRYRDLLRASLVEAHAEAERAAMMAEAECRRQVADMAARMRAQAEAAAKGLAQTADADGQLARLLGQLHELAAARRRGRRARRRGGRGQSRAAEAARAAEARAAEAEARAAAAELATERRPRAQRRGRRWRRRRRARAALEAVARADGERKRARGCVAADAGALSGSASDGREYLA